MRPAVARPLAALAAALSGCGGCESIPSAAVTDCEQGTIVAARVQTDILFVVDDSGSMAREQAALGAAFRSFIDALASSPVANDFQIGITTTSVDWPICNYDAGAGVCTDYTLQTTYSGGAPYPAGALVAAAGRPKILVAGSPTLVDDFVANVNVGVFGASKEQGFRALQLALSDRVLDGSNAGFLRSGARLAIVIVTDEDDCSEWAVPPQIIYDLAQDRCHSAAEQALLPPAADTATFLRGPIAGERREVLLAVVAAVDPVTKEPEIPACNPLGYAAYRYKALVDDFGASARIDDVCQPDFTPTLSDIAALISPGQVVPLEGTPADWRLLAVRVVRAAGGATDCQVGLSGDPSAQVIYTPPQGGQPATLTFQGTCLLQRGDDVQIRVLCAG